MEVLDGKTPEEVFAVGVKIKSLIKLKLTSSTAVVSNKLHSSVAIEFATVDLLITTHPLRIRTHLWCDSFSSL